MSYLLVYMSTSDSSLDSSVNSDSWVVDGSFAKLDLSVESSRRIIAGYANVADVVDNQREKVTLPALTDAWGRWSKNPEYCVIMLAHTSTPIAKVLFEDVIDSKGKVHKSGMKGKGLYLVGEVRSDIAVANKVWDDIQRGKVRGFSIGGARLQPPREECNDGVCYNVLEHFELHETSLVPKPANTWSVFGMLKGELAEVSKVTNGFRNGVLVEDFIKVSKTPCKCGKYHILSKFNVDALGIFNTDTTFITTDAVGGKEYVPLFNLSLLRPYSLEPGVTAEVGTGGFTPAPKTDEPMKGESLKKEVKEEKREVDPSEIGTVPVSIENPVSEVKPVEQPVVEAPVVVAPKVDTPPVATPPVITIEALMARITSLEGELKALKVKPVEVPSAPPVAPVETPIPAETPPPVETSQTRGKVPPPSNSGGLDLAGLSRMTWDQIQENAPDIRR